MALRTVKMEVMNKDAQRVTVHGDPGVTSSTVCQENTALNTRRQYVNVNLNVG